MRISDWSSDVCSSDLRAAPARPFCDNGPSPIHPTTGADALTDTPFPLEPTATDAQQAIKDEFGFFGDWSERYQYLIDLGRKLPAFPDAWKIRSEEQTSELQYLMRLSYAVFFLNTKKI